MNANTAPTKRAVILKVGEGQTITAFGDTALTKLSNAETNGTFCLVLLTTPPRGGPPLHRHTNEDELFIVVSGRYRFVCDGVTHELEAGGVVFLPRQSVHTFMVTGPQPAQAWVMVLPGGFEKFFRRCAAEFPPGIPPDPAVAARIGQEFGIEFLGPPLAAMPQG